MPLRITLPSTTPIETPFGLSLGSVPLGALGAEQTRAETERLQEKGATGAALQARGIERASPEEVCELVDLFAPSPTISHLLPPPHAFSRLLTPSHRCASSQTSLHAG